jgi:hypothetical protein
MYYTDGNEARVGDFIAIDGKYRGTVVACMDRNEYLPGKEHWSYLKVGIMVDTDFAGLVHYETAELEEMSLVNRAAI